MEHLLHALQTRFTQNMSRHPGISWDAVQAKLEASPEKLVTLREMEATGGEPDVIGYDSAQSQYIFCDCSPESPVERRSLCYDQAALDARKANKPKDSAVHMAEAMGTRLLTEAEYYHLQTLGVFDIKTSSWVSTPDETRALDGALFCSRRYNRVFTYHNGAESYYASRGFRAILEV